MKCYSIYPYFTRKMRDELTDAEHRMCELCWAFKNHRDVRPRHKGPARTFEALLGHLSDRLREIPEITPSTLFIPVPSSDKTSEASFTQWPAYDLASRLNGQPCKIYIRRTHSIEKSSATEPSGQLGRLPNDRSVGVHERTMECTSKIPSRYDTVCLIDDLITYGSTLLGAEKAVQKAGFRGKIIAATGFFTWSSGIERSQRFPTFNLDEKAVDQKKRRILTDSWVY